MQDMNVHINAMQGPNGAIDRFRIDQAFEPFSAHLLLYIDDNHNRRTIEQLNRHLKLIAKEIEAGPALSITGRFPLTRVRTWSKSPVVRQKPQLGPAKADDYDTPQYDNSILIITFGRLFVDDE